jgi:hypothetical protein
MSGRTEHKVAAGLTEQSPGGCEWQQGPGLVRPEKPVIEALLVIYRKWARVARMGSINARAPVLPPAH